VTTEIGKLLRNKRGIQLDVGCGRISRTNFVGMDKDPDVGADIVHDMEMFPYPLPDGCCLTIVASHIMEHIKPWLTVDVMNELWRIAKPEGRLAISTPYAGSHGFWQDPTHCNGFNESTFTYFDPSFPFWQVYRPKPWKILKGFPVWHVNGNIEAVLEKVAGEVVEATVEVSHAEP